MRGEGGEGGGGALAGLAPRRGVSDGHQAGPGVLHMGRKGDVRGGEIGVVRSGRVEEQLCKEWHKRKNIVCVHVFS